MRPQIDLANLHALPAVAEHDTVEFVLEAMPGADISLRVDGRDLEAFFMPRDPRWRWRWNAGMSVGLRRAELLIEQGGGASERRLFEIRVAPRKIDQEQFDLIRADLERLLPGLARSLTGVASDTAAPQAIPASPTSALDAQVALLVAATTRIERATRRIVQRPLSASRPQSRRTGLGEARRFNAEGVRGTEYSPVQRPGAPQEPAMIVPHEVVEHDSRSSIDTYEHRLLKRVIELLIQRAGVFARMAASQAPALAAECDGAVRALRTLQGLPFFAEISTLSAVRGPTHLIQRHPPYREVYQVWQMLRREPVFGVESPLFTLVIDDLPYLYEAWCALQVVQAVLASGVVVHSQQIVTLETLDDGPSVILSANLNQDAPLLTGIRGDCAIAVRYQARYRALAGSGAALGSLDLHTRVPDVAIEMTRGPHVAVLMFDAKYRLDAAGARVPPDALADAYAYHGAIGCRGAKCSAGVLLLYPGTSALEWYPSGVGALSLLPGAGSAELADWLATQLSLLAASWSPSP